jgi:hypothetical protein
MAVLPFNPVAPTDIVWQSYEWPAFWRWFRSQKASFKEHTHEKINFDCANVADRRAPAWRGHGGLWPSLKICQKLLKTALFWYQIGLQTNQYMRKQLLTL